MPGISAGTSDLAKETTVAAVRDRLPSALASGSSGLLVDDSLPLALTDTYTYVSGGVADGKINTVVRSIGGKTITNQYSYDANGKLTSITRTVT